MSRTILPAGSEIYELFATCAASKRMAFVVGVPGTGKSLLLKQLALLAQEAGRTVHMLQWDITRAAFETEALLARYPERDGFTHAAIRKAVGLWARSAVFKWHETYVSPEHFLLGELPLVGNRLVELIQPMADTTEALLTDPQTQFIVPVPSREVRAVIETARANSIANPGHEKETRDAQPNVLQEMWQEITIIGRQLGIAAAVGAEEVPARRPPPYSPELYAAVYQHLLRQRRHVILPVNRVLQPAGSAYDLTINGTELVASARDVARTMQTVESRYTLDELEQVVANWYSR